MNAIKTLLVIVLILLAIVGLLAYRSHRAHLMPQGIIAWRSTDCPAWYWFTNCKSFPEEFPTHPDDEYVVEHYRVDASDTSGSFYWSNKDCVLPCTITTPYMSLKGAITVTLSKREAKTE